VKYAQPPKRCSQLRVKKKMIIKGRQVAAARELLGLNQEELATAASVSRNTLHRFEAGLIAPLPETLEKLQKELESRGIEFSNGEGIGVRLNYAKAESHSLRPSS
jgi:transcriptional regulator with XRE-family HTH domain